MTKKRDHIMAIPTMPIPTMSIPTMPILAPPPIGSSTPHPRCEAGQSFPVHGLFFFVFQKIPLCIFQAN